MSRPEITPEQLERTMERVVTRLKSRIRQKGRGSFSSKHEILGVITEEYNELVEAVHGKESSVYEELMDLAVGSIFSLACIYYKTVDW